MTGFKQLNLIEPLLRAVAQQGYRQPTPIQARAIPLLLEGRDLLGCAQTGTGKTAAFALPMLQLLTQANAARGKPFIRTLVLSPTRELAGQIEESFRAYARHLELRQLVIFGGVKQHAQVAALRRGVHILVATPGRLLDLAGQGHVQLDRVQFFVLDEADRMLDMGFIHDIRRVLELLPAKRQNLLFSATLPSDITRLAGDFLNDPARVEVSPPATTVERISQRVMFVERKAKPKLLAELLADADMRRVLVFSRTKHGANRLVKQLAKVGIAAAAIHGNKSQGARTRAMDGFHAGAIRILVATDLASRGIDVDDISHVVNFDLPHEPEVYVHRIGRTGRAGSSGVAISFCDAEQAADLRGIERLIGERIPVDEDHAWHSRQAMSAAPVPAKPERPGRSGGRRRGGRKPNHARPKAAEASGRPPPSAGPRTEPRRPRRRRGRRSSSARR